MSRSAWKGPGGSRLIQLGLGGSIRVLEGKGVSTSVNKGSKALGRVYESPEEP